MKTLYESILDIDNNIDNVGIIDEFDLLKRSAQNKKNWILCQIQDINLQ